MDIKIEPKASQEATIKITLSQEDYQTEYDQKLKEYGKKAQIRGFRPGKVPTSLIRQMYGNSLRLEIINDKINQSVAKLIEEKKYNYVGRPIGSETQPTINWESNDSMEFHFDIGFIKDFEIPLNKKFKIDFNKISIDEKLVSSTIESLLKSSAKREIIENVEDDCEIKFDISNEKLSHTLNLSTDTSEWSTAMAKKVKGKKIGDEFDESFTNFFNDSNAIKSRMHLHEGDDKILDKKVTFKILEINKLRLPSLNQDIFDQYFGKDSVKSESEFRDRVKKELEKNYEQDTLGFFQSRLQEKIVNETKIELPEEFLKKWLMDSNNELNASNIEIYFAQYANELKWSEIVKKIMQENQLTVSPEEINDEAKKVLKTQFGEGIVEALGEKINSFIENYLKHEEGKNYLNTYLKIQNDKVLNFISSQISVNEKVLSLDEYRKL